MSGNPPKIGPARLLDWLSYLFVACYVYVIPQFDPLPTSLLTLATLGGLVAFSVGAPAGLAAFKGRGKACLWLVFAVTAYGPLVNYLTRGAFEEGDLLFLAALFCAATIVGRSTRRQDGRETKRLLIAFVIVLALSMVWFLLTYFSSSLFSFHMGLYKYGEQELWLQRRSGLSGSPHLFGYHLAPLTICLFTAAAALSGKKRLAFVALAIVAAITVLLYGERSVFLAIVAGLALLLQRTEYRRKIVAVAVLAASVFAIVLAEQSFVGWRQTKYQADLATRLASAVTTSETANRVRLQLMGLNLLWEYPEGLVTAGKDWEDLVIRRDTSLFDIWGRIIAVHNGYLGVSIDYGWPMAFLVLLSAWAVVKIALALVRHPAPSAPMLYPMLGAALTSSLVQALFHNASFATHEPATTVLLLLALAAYSHLRSEARTTRSRESVHGRA